MKKTVWMKMTAWVMVLTMMISLTACGSREGGNGGTKTGADTENMVFSGTDFGMETVKGYPSSFVITDDRIYFLATEYPEDEGSDADESDADEEEIYDPGITRIYSMNPDGSDIAEICEPSIAKEDGFIRKLLLGQDESFLLFAIDYDEKTDTQQCLMIRADEKGNVKERVDLQEAIAGGPGVFISDVCIDEKGDYILTTDNAAFILDSGYKKTAEVKSGEGWLEGSARTPDGKIICSVFVNDGPFIKELDTDKGKFGEPVKLGASYITGTDSLLDGYGNYDFFYKTDQGIFGYSLEDQTSTEVMDFMASEINSDNSYDIVPIDMETMIGTSWDGGMSNLTLYKKIDAQKSGEKTTVTFGSMWGIADEIRTAAVDFNKENDQYKIEFRDYSSEEDPQTRMIADILAGDAPDIIDLSYIPLEPYAKKGILEDLTPYLENDDLVSKDDILPSVEKAMEIDGKLYYLSSSFNVKTILASKKDVGDKTGWTFEELKTLLDEKGEGVSPFRGKSKLEILSTFTHAGINDFIDWGSGTCSFNSDDFKSMLEVAGRGSEQETAYGDDTESELLAYKEGTVLFWEGYAIPEYLQGFQGACGSDATYIGYPCEDKNGSYFSLNNQIGIYAKSKVKDAAWKFLRVILTPKFQAGDGYIFSNPTNKEAFEMYMKMNTTTKAYRDDFGHKIKPVRESWKIDGEDIKIGPLSAEDEKKYRDLISRTSKIVTFDDTVLDIIEDEAAGYFNGQKSLDETADIIQNRITTYVNEKR